MLSHPTLLAFIRHEQLGKCLRSFTGRELVAVAARLETSATSEVARWRQESTVTVRERLDVSGFGPWTSELGIPHVGAPSSVLKQMLIVRIVCGSGMQETPSLQVLVGSHQAGKLTDTQLTQLVAASPRTTLQVPSGTLLLIKPLLVHSAPAGVLSRRYHVLHLTFAPAEAISPLQWSSRVELHTAA